MSRPKPTRRQQRILTAIAESVRDRGYPPSVRELAAAAGLSSPSSVQYQLHQMVFKGLIERDATVSRGIRIVPHREHREAS